MRSARPVPPPGAVPPFDRVALDELAAGVQQQLPARQIGREKNQRQHVLQLVAIAGRAGALRRPGAAPQPRRQQLIGQPVVDEPVELRLVRLDPQDASVSAQKALVFRDARRPNSGFRAISAKCRASSSVPVCPMREDDRRFALRLHFDRAGKSRDLRSCSERRRRDGRARPCRAGRFAARCAQKAPTRRFREFRCERVETKAQPLTNSYCGDCGNRARRPARPASRSSSGCRSVSRRARSPAIGANCNRRS